MAKIYHMSYLVRDGRFCPPCTRVAAAQDTIWISLQEITSAIATTRRDGDSQPSLHMAVMGNSEAVVHGLSNGHDFQDIGQLFKGDAAHSRFSKLYRLMEPGAADGVGLLMLKSLRISCALLFTMRHKG